MFPSTSSKTMAKPLPLENDLSSRSRQAKNSSKMSRCLVCGDRASIINYGALSCQSCKTFFRRNASHLNNVHPCFFNKTCKIQVHSRRICTACRLEKCLEVGMSYHLIRKEMRRKQEPSNAVESISLPANHKFLLVSSLPTLGLLRADRSSLMSSDWTLISNIIHAYDRFSVIPAVRRQIDDLAASQFRKPYEISNVLESVFLMYTSTNSFITSVPDFQILTINEQRSLFDRNFHGVLSLVSIIFMRSAGIFDHTICSERFASVYGCEMFSHATRINARLDSDLTILKILIILLTFSSNCFMIDSPQTRNNDSLIHGTFRLFGSQNAYIEVLWKFMIYRYGYEASVLRFAKLIELFLAIIKHCSEIYATNVTHQNLVDGVVDQMKRSLTVRQNDQVTLWGKT